jgi:hypothetical protein
MTSLKCIRKRVPIRRSVQEEIEGSVPLSPLWGPSVEIILTAPEGDYKHFQKSRYALIYADVDQMKQGMKSMREY